MQNNEDGKKQYGDDYFAMALELTQQLRDGTKTPRQVRRFLDGEDPFDDVHCSTIQVDCVSSTAQTIARSHWDEIHPSISAEHFPQNAMRKPTIVVERIPLPSAMSTQQVIEIIQHKGLWQLDLVEAMSYCETLDLHSSVLPVVALCGLQIVDCMHDAIACLIVDTRGRRLDIHWFCHFWPAGTTILAAQNAK